MINRNVTGRVIGLLVCLSLFTAGGASASPSNKWRLQFSGGAHSGGAIEFRVEPVGGEPITVTVEIEKGTSENGVAAAVVKAFREQLPEAAFHIERDDGEDVLVRRRHGAANFDLVLVSNHVKHVRINPDRE